MAAISKAWVTLTDAATDADSPVDQALVQGIRDDLVHLREWLGASYTAGAVQDHNHDGQNSALVEIGPNAIRNGSFESDGDGWTITTYTGGSHSFNTANDMDGAKALALTSTVIANGGAQATNNEFLRCAGDMPLFVRAGIKASVANVSSQLEVIWYDDAQGQISTTTIYSATNTPTTKRFVGRVLIAPSNARFYKLRYTGGVPGSGSSAGTTYLDGVVAGVFPFGSVPMTKATISGSVTTVDFASLQPGKRSFTVVFRNLVMNAVNAGTGRIQLGVAGTLVTTGYGGQNAAGIDLGYQTINNLYGAVRFEEIADNEWVAYGVLKNSSGSVSYTVAGSITLSGPVDTVRIAYPDFMTSGVIGLVMGD